MRIIKKFLNKISTKIYLNPSRPALLLEEHVTKSYFISSSNFNDYYHRHKPSVNRQIISWLIVIFNIYMTFKFFLIGFYNNYDLYYYFGDTFIYLGRPDVMHFLFGFLAFVTVFGRIVFLLFEKDWTSHSLDFVHLLGRKDFINKKYFLNEVNYKKFVLRFYFCYWFFKKIEILSVPLLTGFSIFLI